MEVVSSWPYPRLNINKGYIKPEEEEQGCYPRPLLCRARLRKARQEDHYDLYLSAVDVPYYYGFYNGGQFAALVPIFAQLVIGGCCTIPRHVRRHISHSLFLSLSFSLLFFFFNYDSCPHARSTAPRRFMKSSGMCFHLAHCGCHRITDGRPCPI